MKSERELLHSIYDQLGSLREELDEPRPLRREDHYLDNNELLQLLGISKSTSYRWRQKGQLPYTQIGQKIYYRKSDIFTLLEKQMLKHSPS